MAALQLQRACVRDAAQLQQMALQAFAADVGLYGAYPPDIESQAWYLVQIAQGNFYKALYNDEFAGGVCVELHRDNQLEIKYIYLSEALQNRQLGSVLMRLIEQQFAQVSGFCLFTPYKSYRNQHFYQKLGYVKVGEFQPQADDEFTVFAYAKTRE